MEFARQPSADFDQPSPEDEQRRRKRPMYAFTGVRFLLIAPSVMTRKTVPVGFGPGTALAQVVPQREVCERACCLSSEVNWSKQLRGTPSEPERHLPDLRAKTKLGLDGGVCDTGQHGCADEASRRGFGQH